MAQTLSPAITTQKNALATSGAWLLLMEIWYDGVKITSPDPGWVNNTEDLIWDAATWKKKSFRLAQVKESLKGELPKTTLTIYDVDEELKTQLQDNDGLSQGEVRIRRIYSDKDGNVTNTGILQFFNILETQYSDGENAIVFNIGVQNLVSKRFPRDRYVSTICRHIFKGGLCRYGEDTDGSGNSLGSITLTNQIRFVINSEGPILQYYIWLAPYAAFKISVGGILTKRFNTEQWISITGSGANNGRYQIEAVLNTDESTLNEWAPYNGRSDGGTHYRLNSTDAPAFTIVGEGLAGRTITIAAVCDHSVFACGNFDNLVKYGGSPGISEGIYG